MCPSWTRLGVTGEGWVADHSAAGGLEAWEGPGRLPRRPRPQAETFKLDESTNSAICQPTVFLFLTPEKYSLPRLLRHSWWGVG